MIKSEDQVPIVHLLFYVMQVHTMNAVLVQEQARAVRIFKRKFNFLKHRHLFSLLLN